MAGCGTKYKGRDGRAGEEKEKEVAAGRIGTPGRRHHKKEREVVATKEKERARKRAQEEIEPTRTGRRTRTNRKQGSDCFVFSCAGLGRAPRYPSGQTG